MSTKNKVTRHTIRGFCKARNVSLADLGRAMGKRYRQQVTWWDKQKYHIDHNETEKTLHIVKPEKVVASCELED